MYVYVCVWQTHFAHLKLIVSWIKHVNNFLIKTKENISECSYQCHDTLVECNLPERINDSKKSNILRPLQAHHALLWTLYFTSLACSENIRENSHGRKLLKGLFHLDMSWVLGEHPNGLAHLSSSTGFLSRISFSWAEQSCVSVSLCLARSPVGKWSDVGM